MSTHRPDLSQVLVSLMKGVTYRENDELLWHSLVELQARVRDHVGLLGLDLDLDEAEGYAFLRQRPMTDDAPAVPRLIPRRPLSYPVSLLLALLRKKLAEFDATSGDSRLVMSRREIVDMVRLFLPDTGNEAKLVDRVDAQINKIVDLGFLRPLGVAGEQVEVNRILKAFVDAQWLHEFETRLAAYRNHATAETGEGQAS